MEQSGKQLFAGPSLIALLLFIVLVTSCALPKIVVLEDTLTADQHNDLGYVYETKGMLDLAEKEYSLAAKKRADWYVPWFNRGNLAFKKSDYRLAENCLREALRRAPDNADVMNNLANALLMQGRYREARQMIEQALQIERKEVYLDTLESIRKRESAAPE